MRSITSSAQIQPQSTARIMMIRPARFRFNEATADSNKFQQEAGAGADHTKINEEAKQEFDLMIEQLGNAGVDLYLFEDDEAEDRPDAVFSNNWVSFHQSGKVVPSRNLPCSSK